MSYPSSGSVISSSIHSGLSTQITVKVGSATVGAIQRLTVNQNREIHIHEEIGTDGVIESHPKGAAKIDLQVTRVVFDGMRLPEAFARGFINIQAQRIPFDVQLIDRSIGVEDNSALVHVFNNCWFKNYSPTFAAETFLVIENATLTCEYVTTSVAGQSAVSGGLRGIRYDSDTVESTTDVTGRRGRLDATGQTSTQTSGAFNMADLLSGGVTAAVKGAKSLFSK